MTWIAAFLLPLVVAMVIGALGRLGGLRSHQVRAWLVRLSWLAVVPAGVAALVDPGGVHRIDWMLLGTTISIDGIARPLVLMAVALYGLALSFVVRGKSDRTHVLTAFLLLCFTGNVAVFLVADLVTFYLAFAAMSFLGYAIVVHDRTDGARRAGAIYLVLTVVGECAVLAALMILASEGVTTVAEAPAAVAVSPWRDALTALLLIGFGVKAGTVPLHVWLPLAHPAAPSPASAVLSGAMLKAGIVGWLRFLPLGESAEPVWGGVFLALGLVGGLLAAAVGVLHDNPKVVLAYSSISQMGFLTAVIGAALVAPDLAPACVAAVVVYSVSHGLVKGALFLGVQAWDAERMPRALVLGALAVASLALVGVPFTSGFVAKYAGKEAVGDVLVPLVPVAVADVLPWFGVGSTLLLARFFVVLMRRTRHAHRTAVSRDVAWVLVSVAAVVPVAVLADAWAPPVSVPDWFSPSTMWAQTWPLLVGLAASAVAWGLARRVPASAVLHPRGDVIPPGDIVVIEERAARALGRVFARASGGLGAARDGLLTAMRRSPSPWPAFERVQAGVGTWVGSGVVLVLILAAALWVAVAWGGAR
ncbi:MULTISPECIES: complex I subunit 5 family protein [Microbacterium]|uniref:complex I subunit 5 family protein n=1 Tax=Microbacterium TaxID=33882 RepID=UPI00277F416D|nr:MULTISPECIES: complex I subunit 5 family protein [Microbacterium]MDQ1081995.1 hydrogenase-4 component B [Microbacterium sp. SORGH_AS_0344]MDQ1169238.1 hydrogenase-4 component B [Microbacterium proteolyticum]